MKVFDNILPSYLQDYVEQSALHSFKWDFLQDVTYVNDVEGAVPGFGYTMYNNDGAIDHLYPYFQAIMIIISKETGLPFEHIKRIRFGLNLNLSKAPYNNIHKDISNPHTVCLYYVTDSDSPTYFFNESKECIEKVYPKKGRAVVFDGSIYHASSCPSKGARIVCNIIYEYNP